MILLLILALPLVGGMLASLAGGTNARRARAAMVAVLVIDALSLIWMWGRNSGISEATGDAPWIARFSAEWISQLGIRFSLEMDGLALLLSLMTCVVGLAAILTLNQERANPRLHSFLLMSLITAMLGVFLAADLMLFFIFYEVMLLPAYALVAIWGSGDARRASLRFFLFTQTSGLLMLIAIVGLHVAHYNATGVHTFAYLDLINTELDQPLALLFVFGFFVAFAVKLPLVPFHTWQPDAYASAPTEVTILFSAVMAKTAGYGLLRFAVPLFPEGLDFAAPVAMSFGVITILYASGLAYGQKDLKRLIAYSSAGHLGYVVLGAFAGNDIGTQGAIMQMICHGLSVTGLFLVADVIEQRTGTRDVDALGGVWKSAPRLGAIGLFFALATLGLPGIGNFVGEFLTLLGAFEHQPVIAAIGVLGAVLSAAYALRFVQRVFFGPEQTAHPIADIPTPALAVCAALICALIWMGLYPQPVLDAADMATVEPPVIVVSDSTMGNEP